MCQHITPIMASLQNILFKTLSVVCKSINGLAPCYTVDMLTEHTSERLLTSSNNGFLPVPEFIYNVLMKPSVNSIPSVSVFFTTQT